MARIFLVCLVLFAAALPLPARADRVTRRSSRTSTPTPLNRSEKRLLQTALAVSGDYRGPLDGDWGAGEPGGARRLRGPRVRRRGAQRPRRRAGPRLHRRGERQRLGLPLPARARRLAGAAAGAPRRSRARGRRRAALERRRPPDRPDPPLRRGRGAPLAWRGGQGQRRRRGARHRAARRPAGHRGSAPGRAELLHPLGPDRRALGDGAPRRRAPRRPGR